MSVCSGGFVWRSAGAVSRALCSRDARLIQFPPRAMPWGRRPAIRGASRCAVSRARASTLAGLRRWPTLAHSAATLSAAAAFVALGSAPLSRRRAHPRCAAVRDLPHALRSVARLSVNHLGLAVRGLPHPRLPLLRRLAHPPGLVALPTSRSAATVRAGAQLRRALLRLVRRAGVVGSCWPHGRGAVSDSVAAKALPARAAGAGAMPSAGSRPSADPARGHVFP